MRCSGLPACQRQSPWAWVAVWHRTVLLTLLLWTTADAWAGPPPAPEACRSVHLFYPAPEAAVFYNEITVTRSDRGTYFAVCAWDQGYFGLQELGNGHKLLIFSVWDGKAGDARPDRPEPRAALLYRDPQVRAGRFGGEGTGGQAFFDYAWQLDTPYRLLVRATRRGPRTEYAGYFCEPATNRWRHLATFDTLAGGKLLGGYYSFVEDFQRDRISATRVRDARFGNGWCLAGDGIWTPLTTARFTADDNQATNINAGVFGDGFFLTTGGSTQNRDAKLQELLLVPVPSAAEAAIRRPPLPD